MISRKKNNLHTSWILFIFCFFVCAEASDFESINLNGMTPPQVEIIYPEESTHAGSIVSVQITIPEGWHVNANITADQFLKPSTLQIQARGIEFAEPIWPAPIKEYSEALDFENLVFKGKFSVEIPIEKISPDYDTSTTNVDFGYQACSNICLAPQSVHASLEIKSLQSKLSESAFSRRADFEFNALRFASSLFKTFQLGEKFWRNAFAVVGAHPCARRRNSRFVLDPSVNRRLNQSGQRKRWLGISISKSRIYRIHGHSPFGICDESFRCI